MPSPRYDFVSIPPSIHWSEAPAVSALVYGLTISADFHRPCRMLVSVGVPAPLIIRASPTVPLWFEKTSPSKPPLAEGEHHRELEPAVGHGRVKVLRQGPELHSRPVQALDHLQPAGKPCERRR